MGLGVKVVWAGAAAAVAAASDFIAPFVSAGGALSPPLFYGVGWPAGWRAGGLAGTTITERKKKREREGGRDINSHYCWMATVLVVVHCIGSST